MNGSMLLGQVRQLKALGKYSDGVKRYIENPIWNSSTSAIVIDLSGSALAEKLGVSSISAKESLLSQIIGSALISVIPAALRSIEITPTIQSVRIGDKIQFTATGSYSNQTTQEITNDVKWETDDSSIFIINKGLFQAKEMPATQTAKITVTQKNISSSLIIEIKPADLVGTGIYFTNSKIRIGDTGSCILKAQYSDDTLKVISENVAWTTTDNSVVVIDSFGKLSPIAIGTATIRAVYNQTVAEASITIYPATLNSITISPVKATININENQQFTAVGKYSDGTSADVTHVSTWTSGSNLIAAASVNTGVATAISLGSTIMKAELDGVSEQASLDIKGQNFVSIAGGAGFNFYGIKEDGKLYKAKRLVQNSLTNERFIQVGVQNNWESIEKTFNSNPTNILAKTNNKTLKLCKYDNVLDALSFLKEYPLQSYLKYSADGTNSSLREAFIRSDGTLWFRGYGAKIGESVDRIYPDAFKIGLDQDWKDVMVGADITAVVKADGSIWISFIDDNRYATELVKITDNFKYFFTHLRTVMTISQTGSLFVFGEMGWEKRKLPTTGTQIDGLWASVAFNSHHAAGIQSNGTLWTWGKNEAGQLGRGYKNQNNNESTEEFTPKQISPDKDWKSVAVNDYGTFALKTDNTLWVTGASGLIGDRMKVYTTITPV